MLASWTLVVCVQELRLILGQLSSKANSNFIGIFSPLRFDPPWTVKIKGSKKWVLAWPLKFQRAFGTKWFDGSFFHAPWQHYTKTWWQVVLLFGDKLYQMV